MQTQEFMKNAVESIQATVGGEQVLLAASGGKDSATTLAMLIKALGPSRVVPVFFDWGLGHKQHLPRLRTFASSLGTVVQIWRTNLVRSVAFKSMRPFLISRRRAAFRQGYVACLAEASHELGTRFVAQGTVAADLAMQLKGQNQNNAGIEAELAKIDPGLMLVEPLALLHKDAALAVGHAQGVPDEILSSYPFPGPGYLLRVYDFQPVTRDRMELLARLDEVVADFYGANADQAFAAIGPPMGNGRAILVRAVTSDDFMEADVTYFDLEHLEEMLRAVSPKVKEVWFRMTPKPPATVELG